MNGFDGPIEYAGYIGKTHALFRLCHDDVRCGIGSRIGTASGAGQRNGRYSFNPVADGVLRLDTRTGQVSQCSRSDAGWTCRAVPDERSSLETEIARLQGENATLKKELLARGLPLPGVPSPPAAKPSEPELKLPSDADVDKVMSFLEKVWRRLIEMGRTVQRDVEKKN